MSKVETESVKNKDQYESLREKGMSKEKAARIANTSSEDMDYNSTPYEERSFDDLYDKAKELGIEGRSDMSKDELIEALREQ
ncbi:MAG: Rho termination factor N-terminal domain-containing protein [Verrucomicrobiales bacterium]|nr:Rho termination factor N-terminal domain-containing protein [Verrucomicrobiales bacterium]